MCLATKSPSVTPMKRCHVREWGREASEGAKATTMPLPPLILIAAALVASAPSRYPIQASAAVCKPCSLLVLRPGRRPSVHDDILPRQWSCKQAGWFGGFGAGMGVGGGQEVAFRGVSFGNPSPSALSQRPLPPLPPPSAPSSCFAGHACFMR